MTKEWTDTSPKYGSWQDVPAGEQNSIDDMISQWERLIGYSVDVPDWAKTEMAQRGIGTLFQVGQYMWAHIYSGHDPGAYFVPPQAVQASPGAAFGLTNDDLSSKLQAYQQEMLRLTGGGGNWDDFWNRMKSGNGQLNIGLMEEQMKQDPATLKQYGWLKYGMDYDQFLQQKVQFEQHIGHDLSNDQAVTQLQYMHAGTAASQSVSQAPTLTQVEKRQAQTGVGQSQVR
jgi:hypothetical protein